MINIIEFCSGIGAISEAFRRSNIDINILGYSDIDKWANKAFAHLHGQGVELGDILKIDRDWWVSQDIDILSYGFPCQDISQLGYEKGMSRESHSRSSLAWHILDLVKINPPKALIIENVANLVGKNHIKDFEAYLSELKDLGYNCKYTLAQGIDFNIPQLRKRVYVVCVLNNNAFEFSSSIGCSKTVLGDIVENVHIEDQTYYVGPYRDYLERWKHLNSIIRDKVNRKYSFTIPHKYANRGVLGVNWIYDKSIDDFRIFTEREVGRLMGWTDDRIDQLLSINLPKITVYELYGNSIIVDVIEKNDSVKFN